jgi:hypothetical protein
VTPFQSKINERATTRSISGNRRMTSKSRTRNCGTVIDPSHSNKENIDPSKIEVFGGNHLKQSFICTSKS